MKNLLVIFLFIPCLFVAQPSEKSSLKVLIQGLEEAKGKVAIQICDVSGEAVEEHWLFVTDHKVILDIPSLAPGRYALKFFHDANNNGTMDKNFFGIPTEMFGFSNDAKPRLGPPDLEEMLFSVDGHTEIVVNAKKI